MAEYGRVEGPFWNNKPVCIIGGGPSLIGFDFNLLRGAHVLAVKGSIFDIPWADAGFGLDYVRFVEWQDRLAALQMRIYWAVDERSIGDCPDASNITYLKRSEGGDVDISTDREMVFGGGTSGFGALQVAMLRQARQIYLFGYDYNGNYTSQGHLPDEFRHNSKHYLRKRRQEEQNWRMWANYFSRVEWKIRTRGVTVINACPGSHVTAFPKMTINDAVHSIRDQLR